MSPAGWSTLDGPARRVLLDQLLERLPSWLELVELLEQPRWKDTRSGEGWRLFTGGEVTLGLTPERLAAIEAICAAHPFSTFDPTVYLPAQALEVGPFLMMEQPLGTEGEPRYFLSAVNDSEGQALLSRRGGRLPTEAEWEFAWWAVQTQPEHWAMASAELCADAWAPRMGPFRPAETGEAQVVRTSSPRPDAPESVLPSRQPSSLSRMHTLRAVLDVPRL